jgi:hypothetical protein
LKWPDNNLFHLYHLWYQLVHYQMQITARLLLLSEFFNEIEEIPNTAAKKTAIAVNKI